MSEEVEKQEGQKTVVAFIAGLLIGGLLVWVFSGSPEGKHDDHDHDDNDDHSEEVMDDSEANGDDAPAAGDDAAADDAPAAPVMNTGDGDIDVNNQSAGLSVAIDGATFPNDEGWIAVRSYTNDQLGNILGAARFSKEQGLVPSEVPLLTPTVAGREYAVVFFTEDGNRTFNLSGDVQVEGVWTTFTAQ